MAQGESDDAQGLDSDLTLPVTILAQGVISPDQTPEEVLWERTLTRLQNFVPVYEGDLGGWDRRLRYQGWSDAPELLIGHFDVAQLARQTVFKVRFSLEPEN